MTFPNTIASHTREQVTYFGADGLMRRHEYSVDVLGAATGAQYIHDYRQDSGIMVPHRRRVYPRAANNERCLNPCWSPSILLHASFPPDHLRAQISMPIRKLLAVAKTSIAPRVLRFRLSRSLG